MATRKLMGPFLADDKAVRMNARLRSGILNALELAIPKPEITEDDVASAYEILQLAAGCYRYNREEAPKVSEAVRLLGRVERLARNLADALAKLAKPEGKAREPGYRAARSVEAAIESAIGDKELLRAIGEATAFLARSAGTPARRYLEARVIAAPSKGHLDWLIDDVAERFFRPRHLSQSYKTDAYRNHNARSSGVASMAFLLGELLPLEMRPASEAAMVERHVERIKVWKKHIARVETRRGKSPQEALLIASAVVRGKHHSS
jgi:hypothetical protein